MQENACSCSCFGLLWPQFFGKIHAHVPFLVTQARIMYEQFLYIAGNGIADAKVRIMGEGKGKKVHVAVPVSVYSGQKIWNNSRTSPVFWPHKPESGIGSSCI